MIRETQRQMILFAVSEASFSVLFIIILSGIHIFFSKLEELKSNFKLAYFWKFLHVNK